MDAVKCFHPYTNWVSHCLEMQSLCQSLPPLQKLQPGRVPTSFWWYLMASLSLAKSWHCLGSSSSLWSLSLWFRMVSSSLELLAWSRRSLAKRLHCWDSSSYSWRNSFSTWNMEWVACYVSTETTFETFWTFSHRFFMWWLILVNLLWDIWCKGEPVIYCGSCSNVSFTV